MALKSKRGQITMEQFVIIGVLVVAFVIYLVFFTSIGDKIRGVNSVLPKELTLAVNGCTKWIESDSTKISFCEFKEIKLSTGLQWANCNGVYMDAKKVLNESSIGFKQNQVLCNSEAEVNQCFVLMKTTKAKSSALVNLDSCKNWLKEYECMTGPKNLSGNLTSDCGDKKDISSWCSKLPPNQKCCLSV
jgi:glucose uptake protein GlcU